MDYRRAWHKGGTYFFTVNCLERKNNDCLVRNIDLLRGVWQRRYWEHLIRDERDYQAHMDYVHINPVKHGLVKQVKDWPYSTFHKWVEQGVYLEDWGGGMEGSLSYED